MAGHLYTLLCLFRWVYLVTIKILVLSFTCLYYIFYFEKQYLPTGNSRSCSSYQILIFPHLLLLSILPPSWPICRIPTFVPILYKGLLGSFMFEENRLLKSLLASRSSCPNQPCARSLVWALTELTAGCRTKKKRKSELCQQFHFPHRVKCLFYVNYSFWLFLVQPTPWSFNM